MLPNFLIIGAARSGTTSIYHNLIQHPDIFMPITKEPQYFTSNFKKGTDWYRNLFAGHTTERAVGEASMTYTYPEFSSVVPQRIANLVQDVRLIYIIRNPVTRAYSHYNYYRYYSKDETLEFEKALKENMIYLGTSMYFTHIQNYLRYFDDSKIKVVIFEEYVNNPSKVLSDIYHFLGVDPTFISPTTNVKTNATFKAKNDFVFNLYKSCSLSPARTWLEKLIPQKMRPLLRNNIRSLLSQNTTLAPISPHLAIQLQNHFLPEIQKLENYLQNDLGIWKMTNGNPPEK